MTEELEYPGLLCGLTEDEWVLEKLIDELKSVGTLEAIGKLRRLFEVCNIDTHSLTQDNLIFWLSKMG